MISGLVPTVLTHSFFEEKKKTYVHVFFTFAFLLLFLKQGRAGLVKQVLDVLACFGLVQFVEQKFDDLLAEVALVGLGEVDAFLDWVQDRGLVDLWLDLGEIRNRL